MSDAKERKITAPSVNPETQQFWDATGQGKLLYKKCAACGEPLRRGPILLHRCAT